MAILTVGSNKQFATLSQALAASRDGDTIQIDAGVYENDFATITTKVSIVAVGGLAHLKATVAPPNGKAILTTRNDVTIDGLEFSGAAVADRNGAGIRYELGHLVVRNSYFHDNENGILASANSAGTIAISTSEFARNGYGDGYTHGIYVNNVAKLTVTDSHFHGTKVGHHIKSRAAESVITNNKLIDGSGGTSSYSIDLPNGGKSLVKGNFLEQASTGQNPIMISYGAEGNLHAGGALIVDANVFSSFKDGATGVRNHTATVAQLTGNSFYNVATKASGTHTESGSIILAAAPAPSESPTGDVIVVGTAADDTLYGGSGNDTIDGKAGADTMHGRAGNDLYHVDNRGDRVAELAGEGRDTVIAGVGFTLPADVEELQLGGSGRIGAAGNDLANVVGGNSGYNVIKGGGGDDTLTGGAGNDTFVVARGQGSDVITDFQAGAAHGDVVRLAGTGLTDFARVQAAMTASGSDTVLALGNGETLTFENVAPSAFAANDFFQKTFYLANSLGPTTTRTGTSADDTLTGTTGRDLLDGRAGADAMSGGAGDDTYVVDNSGDAVGELAGGGRDTVRAGVGYTLPANVENLMLTGGGAIKGVGNALANKMFGNGAANRLVGGAGDDLLIGMGGGDVLTGGMGADSFQYTRSGQGGDTVTDFTLGQDVVDLRWLMKSVGYAGTDPLASGHLALAQSGANARVIVDADGSAGGGAPETVVTLLGVAAADLVPQADVWWQ